MIWVCFEFRYSDFGLLLACYLDRDSSSSGAVEFTKIDSLPGTELHLPVVDEYRLAASED